MNAQETAGTANKRGEQRLCLTVESMRDHWGLTSCRENALRRGIFDQHIPQLPFMHEKQGHNK